MFSSPNVTADVTGALRGFRSGVLTQRHALGVAMMRQMAATTAVAVWSRAKLKRGMHTTAAGAMSQLADALLATVALLDSQTLDRQTDTTCAAGGFIITDRAKTRC
jgi:hypothetical protein